MITHISAPPSNFILENMGMNKRYLSLFRVLYLKLMELKAQSLKELYEKDFYLWLQENLRLLKNRELDLVDWENLVEEIEDMGKSLFKSVRSYISTIMEHLYKWENFRYVPEMGYDWIETITNARRELRDIFEDNPSLRVKAQDSETLRWAWKAAVRALVDWFENPKNKTLVLTYFKGKLPTEKDFPSGMPLYLPAGDGIQAVDGGIKRVQVSYPTLRVVG
jgi:hypothetical protein